MKLLRVAARRVEVTTEKLQKRTCRPVLASVSRNMEVAEVRATTTKEESTKQATEIATLKAEVAVLK